MGYRMDKIGIVTLVGRSNYGNRLQNYAATRIFEGLGYQVDTLNYAVGPNLIRRIKDCILKTLGKDTSNPENNSTSARLNAFHRFDDQLNVRAVSAIRPELAGEYAYFAVGSDQVWNPGVSASKAEWYFLGFAERKQRVALAPSIGVDSLTSVQGKVLREGVAGFDCLSVRERRGAELIREWADIDAEIICDPTLVLPAEKWRAVADGRCTPEGPYVFTYLLGGAGAEATVVLDEVTDHGRITVIPLTDRQKPGEPDAGPAEFIDLIDHAVHVVTDSFHAAVFSSILQTPLTIVHREGGASMFSRLEQLSEMLGIEEKVYGSPTYDLARAGEYDGVPEAIEREREKFMTYLEGCLDG